MGGKAQLPAQVWSWVGAPALGGGQSRCQCREVSHSCGVRLEFSGKATKPLPARCAACAPDWGCAGPCAWSLHKVLQVGSGNPWVVHAGAPGDVYRQGTSGEGGHGVGWGQKKSRGWFSFQVPGRGSRREYLLPAPWGGQVCCDFDHPKGPLTRTRRGALAGATALPQTCVVACKR